MNCQIHFDGDLSAADSSELNALHQRLIAGELNVKSERTAPLQGEKDGGLTVALSIVGLAVSGVATLISVLSYWNSTRPNYSLTVNQGDVSTSVGNLSAKELQKTVEALTANDDSLLVTIHTRESS